MQLGTRDLEQSEIYKLLTGAVIPRPIDWISSMSEDRINNLAPFKTAERKQTEGMKRALKPKSNKKQ